MGLNTTGNPTLIRDDVYSQEIKEVLDVALQLDSHVRWVDAQFLDGNTLNIPTVGQLTTSTYVEGSDITLQDPATSNYELAITEYKQAGIQITDKFKEDSVWINELMTIYKKELLRALLRDKESRIANLQAEQTANNPNTINGVDHRFCSLATNEVGSILDLNKARLALNKANVPGGRTGFFDPNFVYELQSIANIVGQDIYGPNSVIKEGANGVMAAGLVADQRLFFARVSGIDIYESNVLDFGLAETIVATGKGAGSKSVTSAWGNMIVGHEAFIGAMRTTPDMVEDYDVKTRSTIIHSLFRYGVDLYRPESLVVILNDAA